MFLSKKSNNSLRRASKAAATPVGVFLLLAGAVEVATACYEAVAIKCCEALMIPIDKDRMCGTTPCGDQVNINNWNENIVWVGPGGKDSYIRPLGLESLQTCNVDRYYCVGSECLELGNIWSSCRDKVPSGSTCPDEDPSEI